jgi:DNA-binding GntR family transcriptional regulator
MSLANLRTPKSLTLSTQIAETLRDAIMDGTLSPGQHLVEAAIAEQMGVSRAPVREAILDLGRQGWVTQVPRKGSFVTEWSRRDIEELYTLRMVLEGLSARLAAIKITPEQLEQLEDIVDELSRSPDVDTSVQLDQRFHCQLCVAADHASLKDLLVGMQMQTSLIMMWTQSGATSMSSDALARRAADHRALLEAVHMGDADLAEQRMREHVELAGQLLLSRLQAEDSVQK